MQSPKPIIRFKSELGITIAMAYQRTAPHWNNVDNVVLRVASVMAFWSQNASNQKVTE